VIVPRLHVVPARGEAGRDKGVQDGEDKNCGREGVERFEPRPHQEFGTKRLVGGRRITFEGSGDFNRG
jgi:hypothetical protein